MRVGLLGLARLRRSAARSALRNRSAEARRAGTGPAFEPRWRPPVACRHGSARSSGLAARAALRESERAKVRRARRLAALIVVGLRCSRRSPPHRIRKHGRQNGLRSHRSRAGAAAAAGRSAAAAGGRAERHAAAPAARSTRAASRRSATTRPARRRAAARPGRIAGERGRLRPALPDALRRGRIRASATTSSRAATGPRPAGSTSAPRRAPTSTRRSTAP